MKRANDSSALGYDNVEVVAGDGFKGMPERAPFDRIIITAAAENDTRNSLAQLAEGGVMVLPLGPHGGSQHIIKLTKLQTGTQRENLIPSVLCRCCRGRHRNIVCPGQDEL